MSLWENGINLPKFETLRNYKDVDILIIGGGLTGINTYALLEEHKNVCLVEANRIGMGVSKNTTGKINFLQENTLSTFLKSRKNLLAHKYLNAELEGMHLFEKIIQEKKISCDFEKVSSYLVTNQEKYLEDLERIKSFLKEEKISVIEKIPKDFSFLDGFGVTDTYVFHPLKYIQGMLKSFSNPSIYENTKIIDIRKQQDGYRCFCENGFHIDAKQVIIACHYPFFFYPYFLPIKTYIEKSYLIAYPVLENKKYTYITMENPSISTRFYDDGKKVYQIFLEHSHGSSLKQNDAQHFSYLKGKYAKKLSETFLWSNVDIMTFDHLPFIGEIRANMFLATGFQAWGMIQSMVSAKIISDYILQGDSAYLSIFSPKRSFFKRLLLLPIYLGLNVFSWTCSFFKKKKWYSKNLTFTRKEGRLVATYKDDNGTKHSVVPVCPHMKCGLIFNEEEKTWDCPCHSSRFDIDGKMMKGPALSSIKYIDD